MTGASDERRRIMALLEVAEWLADREQGSTAPDVLRAVVAVLGEVRTLWDESQDPALLSRSIAVLRRVLAPFIGDRGATTDAAAEFAAAVTLLVDAVDRASFAVEASDRRLLRRVREWLSLAGAWSVQARSSEAVASTRPRRSRGPGDHGRAVSTGFTGPATPDGSNDPHRCLDVGSDYLFWFSVSDAPLPGAIDHEPVAVPADIPTASTLTVALFGFPGEIEVPAGLDVGEITLSDAGWAITVQPGSAHGARLLFPIRTPARAGRYRVRCNVYREQTLLQSHLVTADVAAGAPSRRNALRSVADYVADTALDPAELHDVSPLNLSVLINDNGDGRHGVRFFGHDGTEVVKADAVADPELGDHIERARRALRRATWGSPEEWQPRDRYHYGKDETPDLAADLITMASAGWMIWSSLSSRMVRSWSPGPAHHQNARRALTALLRAPGTLEFATKDGAGVTAPAGIVYDYLLDTQKEALTVCPTAMDAIARRADLAAEPCFQGRCPSHAVGAERDDVVCPGGFWGFRHRIGFPQTVRTTMIGPVGGRPSTSLRPIRFSGRPRCVVGAATDFDQAHPQAVAQLGDASSPSVIVDRTDLLAAWRNTATPPHLVYLFCHGSVSEYGLPALRVGGPDAELLTPDNIDYRVDWHESRPLVILNGCRTAAGEPRHPLRFVDAFIRDASASGVIGTEVTTFPSLAAEFGDLLLGALFEPGVTVADALRRARLALLATGNPLGLIYVGYAAPQLRLDASVSPPSACGHRA